MIEELKRIVNKIDQFDISKNSLSYLNFLVLDLQNGFKSIQTTYGQIWCCISMDKKIFIFKDFINEFNSRNENDTKEIYQKNNPFFIKFINNKKNEFVYKIKNDINILEQEIQKRKIINEKKAQIAPTDVPIKLKQKTLEDIKREREEELAWQAYEKIQRRNFIGGNYNLDENQEKEFEEWRNKHVAQEINQKLKEMRKYHLLPEIDDGIPKVEEYEEQRLKEICRRNKYNKDLQKLQEKCEKRKKPREKEQQNKFNRCINNLYNNSIGNVRSVILEFPQLKFQNQNILFNKKNIKNNNKQNNFNNYGKQLRISPNFDPTERINNLYPKDQHVFNPLNHNIKLPQILNQQILNIEEKKINNLS